MHTHCMTLAVAPPTPVTAHAPLEVPCGAARCERNASARCEFTLDRGAHDPQGIPQLSPIRKERNVSAQTPAGATYWCTKHQHACLSVSQRWVQSVEPHHLLRLQASSWAWLTCLSAVRAPQCWWHGSHRQGEDRHAEVEESEAKRRSSYANNHHNRGGSRPELTVKSKDCRTACCASVAWQAASP